MSQSPAGATVFGTWAWRTGPGTISPAPAGRAGHR